MSERRAAHAWALFVVALFLGISPAPSQAQGALALEWNAPTGCPSPDEVRAEIERLLGGPPYLPSGEPLAARASVTHDDVWRVSLETGAGAKTRRRTLQADSCRGLADATALIVALMIDPEAVASHGPSTAPVASTPPSTAPASPSPAPPTRGRTAIPTRPETAEPTTAAPSGDGSPAPRFFVGPFVSADVGVLPAPDVAGGLNVGLTWRSLRLALAGSYGFGRPTTYVAAPAGPGGTFRHVWGSIVGCGAMMRDRWDAGPCALFEMGSMHGEGVRVSYQTPDDALWVAVGAGVFVSWNVSPRWAIPLRVEALVPLARPRFVLENVGDVFQTAPVSGRATLGGELHF